MVKHSYQRGVEAEFLEAYETYADALFRHCYYRVYNRERAQEVVQETFMKTWEVVSRGEEIRNFRAYVYRVARNLIIDEARRRKLRTETSLEDMREASGFDPGEDKTRTILDRMEGAQALRLLARLSDEDQEILMLRYVDELDPKEIAEMLEVTPNVVSVRSHRALKRLREIINQQQHG